MQLLMRTFKAATIGLIVLGFLIFMPASTLAHWQGWVFVVVFSHSTNLIGVYLALTDPALFERRALRPSMPGSLPCSARPRMQMRSCGGSTSSWRTALPNWMMCSKKESAR